MGSMEIKHIICTRHIPILLPAKLEANAVDLDQTCSAVSEPGLNCLHRPVRPSTVYKVLFAVFSEIN